MHLPKVISIVPAVIALIYSGLIATNMFAWDYCWYSARTQASLPINYLLVAPGVLAQVGHLIAVYLAWRVIDDVARGRDFDIPGRVSKLLLALIFTVSASGAVRHGMLKGDQGRAFFDHDQCWEFSVAPPPTFHQNDEAPN